MIRVTGGAPAGRRRARRRGEELGAQADGGRAAGPGAHAWSTNVPRITDIAIMAEVLRRLGCDVRRRRLGTRVRRLGAGRIDVPGEPGSEADYDLVRRLRASICVLGPLLARRGVRPGGACPAATRSARAAWTCTSPAWPGWAPRSPASTASSSPRRPDGLRGAKIWLDFPSVGATENLLMAAVLAKGVTEIDNAAREPEIVDICRDAHRDGRADRRRGHLDAEIEGVDALHAGAAHRRSATGSSAAPGRSARR